MTITKNQHYVPRYYLKSWTIPSTDRLFCLRKESKEIFLINIKKVAVERFFYGFRALSDEDMKVIEYIGLRLASRYGNENLKGSVRQIFDFYKRQRNSIVKNGFSIRFQQKFKGNNDELDDLICSNEKLMADDWNEGLEKRYCHAEEAGMYGLKKLQSGDMSFWDNENERVKFCYFLGNQYCRTKRMRDGLASGLRSWIVKLKERNIFDSSYEPNMDGISQVLCDFMEAILCYDDLSVNTPILLTNATNVPFITSDNPVINLSALDYKGIPEDFILYYPITPKSALLLADNKSNYNSEVSSVDVNRYNLMLFNMAHSQVYANERNVIDCLMKISKI